MFFMPTSLYFHTTCVPRSNQEVLLDPHFVFHFCWIAMQRHTTDQEIPDVLEELINEHYFKLGNGVSFCDTLQYQSSHEVSTGRSIECFEKERSG